MCVRVRAHSQLAPFTSLHALPCVTLPATSFTHRHSVMPIEHSRSHDDAADGPVSVVLKRGNIASHDVTEPNKNNKKKCMQHMSQRSDNKHMRRFAFGGRMRRQLARRSGVQGVTLGFGMIAKGAGAWRVYWRQTQGHCWLP